VIRIITGSTHRYYESKVEEAGQVPGLENRLQAAQDDVAMWRRQSADYEQQRDQERERTAQLTTALREIRAQLDGQQAEFTQQLREASEPVAALLTDLIHRAEHPVKGPDFRKELALRVIERWTERLTPEEQNDPMALILRIITNTRKPGEVIPDDGAPAPAEEPYITPTPAPKLVG
jgi:multidrug efflux pump subunit AcrA (membrane-fusion protein)